MTFIALDTDLEDDPKLHALISTRRWNCDRGLVFMFRFWRAVRRHAANGDVTDWSNSYIAKQIGMGKLSGLIDDLIAVGLLLRQGDRLIVDRWDEMNGRWIRSNLSKEQRSAGGRTRATTASRNEVGRYVRQLDPGVPRGLSAPPHPGEPEPEPEPEPEEDGADASGSAPSESTHLMSFPTNRRGETYAVPSAEVEEWCTQFPAVDVTAELRKMQAWLKANPNRRKTQRGMAAFIVRWLSKEQDRGRVAASAGVAEVLSLAERRQREKEVSARRARELEESRRLDPFITDPEATRKFDEAMKAHRQGCDDDLDSPREGGAA